MTTKVIERKAAKPKAAKRRTKAVAPMGEGEEGAKFLFGITFEIGGKLVPVTADDLANIKKNGVELKLPEPILLGDAKEFIEWLEKEFGVTIPATSEFPEPLAKIFGKLTELKVTIEKAYVHVLPEGKGTKYTLRVSGEWTEAVKIIGSVKIKGVLFGVSNQSEQEQKEDTVTIEAL